MNKLITSTISKYGPFKPKKEPQNMIKEDLARKSRVRIMGIAERLTMYSFLDKPLLRVNVPLFVNYTWYFVEPIVDQINTLLKTLYEDQSDLEKYNNAFKKYTNMITTTSIELTSVFILDYIRQENFNPVINKIKGNYDDLIIDRVIALRRIMEFMYESLQTYHLTNFRDLYDKHFEIIDSKYMQLLEKANKDIGESLNKNISESINKLPSLTSFEMSEQKKKLFNRIKAAEKEYEDYIENEKRKRKEWLLTLTPEELKKVEEQREELQKKWDNDTKTAQFVKELQEKHEQKMKQTEELIKKMNYSHSSNRYIYDNNNYVYSNTNHNMYGNMNYSSGANNNMYENSKNYTIDTTYDDDEGSSF